MMMIPRRNDFDLLDDLFKDPFFSNHESKMMKTDEKENIKIDVEEGYLTIHASMNEENNNEENGKFVRRERYFGECSRSFYVGEAVETEDVKASFKNGTLKLEVPKKEKQKEIVEKKYVQIED